jgi:hypothetical protein
MTNERWSSRIGCWSDRVSMAALLVLVAVVLVPDGFAWAHVVATGLVAILLVTTAVLARRAVPSMAELIAGVAAQPLRARRAPGRARARR